MAYSEGKWNVGDTVYIVHDYDLHGYYFPAPGALLVPGTPVRITEKWQLSDYYYGGDWVYHIDADGGREVYWDACFSSSPEGCDRTPERPGRKDGRTIGVMGPGYLGNL